MEQPDLSNYGYEESSILISVTNQLSTEVDELEEDSKVNKVVDAHQEAEIVNTASDVEELQKAISAISVSGVSEEYVDNAVAVAKAEANAYTDEQIELITSGAPEAFDTLKEISDWIENHGKEATAMQSAITENAEAIDDVVKDLDENYYTKDESSDLFELISNKVSAITSASTDTEYPSAKAVFEVVKNQTAEIDGDEYISVTKSGTTTEINANIIPLDDAVASAHTVTSMTMTQRGVSGDINFLRNEGGDETHEDGEYYAWNFSADPSSISSELYYTKGYPELNVYDDIYVYSGTPTTFVPMRNESGESMFMVSKYGSIDIEKVDGLLSAADMKSVIGTLGEFYGLTLADESNTYSLVYYPSLNFTKDNDYYYGFKFTQEGIEFVVFTKTLDITAGSTVTLYIFKDKQESEEAKEALDDGSIDLSVLSVNKTKDSGLYKYINDADNAIKVTANGDAFINAEATNRNVAVQAHTASISKASIGQLECIMLKYTYLDTSDSQVKSMYGDWVRHSALDDGKYYAWHMRLQTTIDESQVYYTTVIPGESLIGEEIALYKKNDDGEFVEPEHFVSAEVLALNNPFINGTYSDENACKISKSYGWTIKIGTKTTFHYYQFFTMFEPIKEGDYYVWRGLWSTDEALWYSKDYPTSVGQVIDMYYKEDDEIKLNTGCTYTVTDLTTYSDYNQDGLATAYDVKSYIDNAVSKNEAVIITFPSAQLVDENKQTGLRGESVYIINISNESGDTFYTTIGAETTDTCDTYFEKLKTNLVLLDGTVDNYTEASYIEKTTENKITITWHAHFFQERDDNQGVDLNVADCVCVINFEDKQIDFALTQWADDEMHMIHPIRINVDAQLEDAGTSADTLTMTLQYYDGDEWSSITSKEVINYIKQGYKVEFGMIDTVKGEKVFKFVHYDVWYETSIKNKSWLMLRLPNFDAGEAVPDTETYYFLNNFTVVVFDENGVCKYNNYSETPIKGAVYTYKPINSASGDAYVSANVVKNNLGSEYLVKLATNTHSIETATEEKNGLATAYNVQTYVDSKVSNKQDKLIEGDHISIDSASTISVKDIGKLSDLNTSSKSSIVSAINELQEKVVTQEMIDSLWGMFKICAFNTTDTLETINTFKVSWGIPAGILVFTDLDAVNVMNKTTYDSFDISSEVVGTLEPYFIFDRKEDEFSFIISIDGTPTYKITQEGHEIQAEELTDEFIENMESAGAGSTLVALMKDNKGKYVVDSFKLRKDYGFEYSGDTYYWIDNNKQWSWDSKHILGYETLDGTKTMWIDQQIEAEGYNVGDVVTVNQYNYTMGTTEDPTLVGAISITIKMRYTV